MRDTHQNFYDLSDREKRIKQLQALKDISKNIDKTVADCIKEFYFWEEMTPQQIQKLGSSRTWV